MRNGRLAAGGIAPEFTLPDVDGQLVSLSDRLQEGRNILLVFLRHLG